MARLKSSADRYGMIAVWVHWLSAVLILLLTAFRVLWWWRFDRKPAPLAEVPRWQNGLAYVVHMALLVIIFGMIASGIGMMVLSGAGPAIFGDPGAVMPNFHDVLPRRPHGLGARLLVVLFALHAGAALYHHFIQRDATLKRMW